VTRLAAMAPELNDVATDVEISNVAIDHRNISAGSLFGAFPGSRFNGEDFIAEAVSRGAVAVVARPDVIVDGAVHIADTNPRRRFASIAARFFDRMPGHLVAVTGTNGKTSTVEMCRQLWRMLGHRSASIGTLGITTADDQVKTGLTTPDIVTFLSNLSGLAVEGISHVAYEASSHGLDQHRCEGVPLKAGAFTNLSRDHLDYHRDMESYFAAKMRLFDDLVQHDGHAVIWADDEWSDQASNHAEARGLQLFTVGTRGKSLRLVERTPTALGQRLSLSLQGGQTYDVHLPLIGAYQAANALVAAGLVIATGQEPEDVLQALGRLQPVRGRLERAAITRLGAPVYVDYAHTPDALTAALTALRPHAAGRIILVFGAGGDRDPGKRGPMGAAAAADADKVIVTDDNPRGENPAAIRSAILASAGRAEEIGDRRSAIAAAVAAAGPDDVVLVAGKGHEVGQIVGRDADMRVLPFDDAQVVREEAAR
jgi:UDP-N-acetylmuramoyl-L-alanyl-D-glutamate--2,6-diaminopimelate ligase